MRKFNIYHRENDFEKIEELCLEEEDKQTKGSFYFLDITYNKKNKNFVFSSGHSDYDMSGQMWTSKEETKKIVKWLQEKINER